MKEMPKIVVLADGSRVWEHTFQNFEVTVYLPMGDYMADIINYAFVAPYLLVFSEEKLEREATVKFAQDNGFDNIAKAYGGSVVFVYPTNQGGWNNADDSLYKELICETKIGQYYKDGLTLMRDRFTGEWGEIKIRGMRARTCLYGFGASADYIAKHCMKTVMGEGLFGYGDITPTVCILERLQQLPSFERRDIPVVSIGNSQEINQALQDGLDDVLVKEQVDYVDDFYCFIKKYRRMVGPMDTEPDLEALGMEIEPGYCVVPVSEDNCGDDKGKKEHLIGYVAFYNRAIMSTGKKVPLVLCFHGGGDSAFCMAALSDWHKVANRNDFLLVCVENHMNSTATEAVALLEHLKDTYMIDEEKVYATGFSMGGCKSWDLFQEYPGLFAGVAPMDATFPVGTNVYANPVEDINEETVVPVFYVGGEDSPLPELPFHEEKCLERMKYVLTVNDAINQPDISFEKKNEWMNPIMGVNGDVIRTAKDEVTGSVLTMHFFESSNGCCYSVFGSASKQQHEMRYLNCQNAWKYLNCFRRLPDGSIEGGKMDEVISLYE
ncbi:MAG: hypothetical protein IKY53_02500 [Lachnospiraceae bacterium]|nr:hypothetical protein [Lachnospiraceae bacterium]